MRNTLFATFGGLLLLASCSQQNASITPATGTTVAISSVPSVVVASLQQNFPVATAVSWSKVSLQTYQASFTANSKARLANISATGTFMADYGVIDVTTLPKAVTDYITANYAGATLVRAGTKTDAAGAITQYEVIITLNNVQYELEFDGAGKFLKQETEDGHQQGTAVAQSALPAAIGTYLNTTYPGYAFVQASSRSSNGSVTSYVVDITSNGASYDVLFDATGVFISVRAEGQGGGDKGKGPGGDGHDGTETTIAQADLPATISTYLTTNYGGYTFGSATVDKDAAGTVTKYEVKFTLNGKNYEAEFDATGKFLKLG
ncbi:PepSY-like domain-containing protein [Fibrivirga algicola]|jgi:hypothetical protein|uniref:Putative beta-lactamase-inhibitor-like PepSY-like domain-containing protein n=1 Tax=Fibrivirga algicola TaxID=2950420 RepID=A0ABX0QM85_9BACT|nr:PepSY-like domain-containing protein [Fibrivirga algicola]NID13616.1 hypothetical protein [Fibrivirga algicola]